MHQYDESSDKEDGRSDRRHHNRRRVIDELRGTGQEDASAAAQRAADQTPQGANPRRSDGSASGAELAFIYVRVSTREQARTGGGEEGYSIPAQRAACTEKTKQLGAVVAGIYIDAGESAKSIRRPELQRMLRDIEEQRPRYVIVHKIDRLARNRMDDVAINMALRKAGSELVSCTENISDTPSGKFLYNVMADMAQFYSDNLAQEVNKGLLAKAQDGGTPFRPPLGYLPCRDYRDGILVSSVVVDQQRAPLMKWAFEQYATGDWTAQRLVKALREKGLTTRPTARRPERDVSLTSLLNMLRNPYYMGVVSYRGVTYEGKHEALVTPELWLTVQDVLAVHAHAGEKDRVHTHYLRGTIFCGGCGRRLIFTRATGRHGGTFDYFICPKRHHEDIHCTRRSIRVERVEDGILELYQRLEMPVETVRSIRLGVQAEMAGESVEAHRQAERSNHSLKKLGQERAVLMQAHYAGAVPLDLLKTEMDRLTRAMAAAERQVEASGKHLAEVEAVLEQALIVAAECNIQYRRAPEFVRRQMNQGFYKKLWIAQDGTVERCELTEPFAALLSGWGGLTAAEGKVRSSNKDQEGFEVGQADLGGQLQTPTSGEGRGLNENGLVEVLGLMPAGELVVTAEVERPGRTIELLGAQMSAGGRPVARARAWRLAGGATEDAAGGAAAPLPPRPPAIAWHRPDGWVAGYLEAVEWRWLTGGFDISGDGQVWARPKVAVVEGEQPSALQRVAAVADAANGIAARLDMTRWLYLNTEITLHLHRAPTGEWVGVDAHTVIGPTGLGTVSATLFDTEGHVGRCAQLLTVRAR